MKYLSSPGEVHIFDEVEGVSEEAKRLKAKGVDILIAVGHAGYLKDMEIAEKVPDIDVVVGGHTNTFLWNGDPPSIEESQGPYPTMVPQPSGRKVPVVQAYAFGKYLGNLKVTFDDKGEVIATSGLPILLDNKVPQDNFTLQELVPFRQEVNAVAKKPVGRTRVFLDGKRLSCRMVECNLGNFITDSYINLFAKQPVKDQWSKVAIALLNGGAVRASIDERALNGSITYGDVLGAAPFPNTVDLVRISGRTLKDMFEYSVADYDTSALDPAGGFLQVSGIRVTYDLSKPRGQRVVELLARCNRCRVPIYEPVQLEEVYDVAMSSYLASGGDGYSMLKGNIIEHQLSGVLDYDCIIDYLTSVPPVTIGVEGRIRFVNQSSCTQSAAQFRSYPVHWIFLVLSLTLGWFTVN